MDKRYHALVEWLEQQQGYTEYEITPASSDASFRRYFRVTDAQGSRIVMDAPPAKEDSQTFVNVARQLYAIGLHVPEIFHADYQRGYFLISDLGSTQYLAKLDEQHADSLYADAISALVTMQQRGPTTLADYDEPLLLQEMHLFRDWYLGEHLKYSLTRTQQTLLDKTFDYLAQTALSQPRVCVHRDYHSRNLMVCESGSPGILDFQDAVFGPLSYDLVSLLRDCYIAWPQDKVQAWIKDYHTQAVQAGIMTDVDIQQFKRWFDLMGMQRHLKATGIFARLNYRDGKPGYLQDIPRTLGYIVEVSQCYPELKQFHDFVAAFKP